MSRLTRTGFRNLASRQYLPRSSSKAARTAFLSVSSRLRRFSCTTAADDSSNRLSSSSVVLPPGHWDCPIPPWPCPCTCPFRAFFFCSLNVSVERFFSSAFAFLYSETRGRDKFTPSVTDNWEFPDVSYFLFTDRVWKQRDVYVVIRKGTSYILTMLYYFHGENYWYNTGPHRACKTRKWISELCEKLLFLNEQVL